MVVLETIFTQKHIEDTRNFGRWNSPCLRRRYGAMIVNELGIAVSLGANSRVGKYCSGKECVRDYKNIRHGENVELGGEIHAEQAALVNWKRHDNTYHILVAGADAWGTNLEGNQNYPCHVCAMMIKYAGFKNVWLPTGNIAYPVSIDEVLEFYEQSND